MTTVDVLGTLVVFWIVRQVNGGFVVEGQRCGLPGREPEVREKRSQVNSFFGGFRCCDYFRFARR
eukprot:5320291-Pleurochrysis_carterae.AAC.1